MNNRRFRIRAGLAAAAAAVLISGAAWRGLGERARRRRDAGRAGGDVNEGYVCFQGSGHGVSIPVPRALATRGARRGPPLVE